MFISSRGIFKTISRQVVSISFVVLAGVGGALAPAQVSAQNVCSSAVVDENNDGWGYENYQSCIIPTGTPECSANAILNGNGWGYDNGVSCIVTGGYPVCTSAAINNGGGWGYENYRSCRFASSNAVTSTSTNSTGNSNSNNGYPTCTSVAINNGNGWGYENYRSCQYASSVSTNTTSSANSARTGSVGANAPSCSATAIDNGNGWGYENGVSCVWDSPVPSNTTQNNTTYNSAVANMAPACPSTAIDSGGGWGYDNGVSCVWASASSASSNTQSNSSQTSSVANAAPACPATAINSGGGWGYDNGVSCVWTAATSTSSTANNSVASANTGSAAECSANAEDTGGGWGFEFGQSCYWGSVQPNTERNSVIAAPPPVSVGAIGYQNGTPICLTDSSDGNSDGFGYENDRSCLVVDGTTATAEDPLLDTRWCQPWAEIAYDDYVLQNNTWNSGDVYSDRWSQCIELGGWRGNYVAKWDYNWLDKDEGNDFSVKSYPQVYYGRKTGNSQSGTPEELGVPVMVNNIPEFKVRYKYSETGNAERNVALESFFHTSCEAEEWNKHFEMMVWVGKPNIRTPGTILQIGETNTVNLSGRDWEVYVNPALGWGYVAFVEKTPSTEGWLDWKEFVDWTRFQGPQYGVWPVGNTCMGAIEIGTETFWGNGTFTLEEFRVTK